MAAISGVIRSATIAETTAPNDAPITTATARSTRLPRRMNWRKSFSTGRCLPARPDGSARGRDLRGRAEAVQHFGDRDRPVLALAVLDHGDDRASDGNRGAVQRVDEARPGIAAGPVARVQAPRLVVGRVRA